MKVKYKDLNLENFIDKELMKVKGISKATFSDRPNYQVFIDARSPTRVLVKYWVHEKKKNES